MPRLIEKKLNVLAVRQLSKPGRHADGGGLYLDVKKSGAKAWLFRIMINGKSHSLGPRSLRDVTLAEAREEADRIRRAVRAGLDPFSVRDGARGNSEIPTFEEAARQFYGEHQKSSKNAKHRWQWLNTLETHAFPKIGKRRVSEIDSTEVLQVFLPIWLIKPETARRVRQRMKSVFDWCLAHRYRDTMNPVDAVRKALPRQGSKKLHHAALPFDELPALLEKLRDAKTNDTIKLGLEFLIHTAARTGEVIGAQWNEIDTEKAIWTVSAESMKAGEEHRVPLTPRCLQILQAARQYSSQSSHIFPGRSWTKPLSNMAFVMALRRMGYETITVHGFRSSFRDWTAERTDTPRDICEVALAHQVRDKVEAAYRRTDFFERRRLLMNQWSAFLMAGYK